MKKLLAACAFTALSQMSFAGAVDLSGWQEDADIDANGSWVLQGANDSVKQTINGEPTIFYKDGSNAQGTSLSGSIEVQTTGDDDFIGFVLGYQTGEFKSSSADYWLIDWKQGNQSAYGASASKGLAISHVTGEYSSKEFWGHSGDVAEKQRAANLGSTGWADKTSYLFDLVFTKDLIQVYVDGVLEIDLSAVAAGVASFGDGSFGFYNFSQGNVLYAGITEEKLSPVPVPAAAWLFATGLAGFAGFRKMKKKS